LFFLWKEGVRTSEIVDRFRAVFGEAAELKSTVYLWVDRFRKGRQTLDDDPRSGRPATAVNDKNVHAVEQLVLEDRRVTITGYGNNRTRGSCLLTKFLELSKHPSYNK
jgi:transposase